MRGLFLCAWGSLCSQDTVRASATIQLSLTLESSSMLTLEADPNNPGAILIAGVTTGVPDSRTEFLSVEDGERIAFVTWGEGLALNMREAPDSALALSAKPSE